MPIPASISDLSTTPGSNSPSGSDSPSVLDDHQRTAYAFIKTLSDSQVSLSGNQTIAGVKTFSTTPVVPDDSFTFAKLQNIATSRILGRTTSGSGDIEELTSTQVSSLLSLRAPIQPITASVASNALTLTLNPTTLDFRSATLTSGTVNTRTVSAAISLVISSGSTLGTINAVASRIAVLAIDNAGTVELAAVNLAGGVDLSETGVISTTAEGGAGAADSATVIYSTTARTNVPYRVVGYVESTQATAGTWATAPSTIQGAGGQALAALSSLGYGQTYQDLTASRAKDVTYYNTTGKPIFVSVTGNIGATGTAQLRVNGVNAALGAYNSSTANSYFPLSAVVGPGESYGWFTATGTITLQSWSERR